MGQSPILAINELAESQVQAFQTVNDAVDALEKAGNRITIIDATGLSDYPMQEQDFVRSQVFVFENLTEDLNVFLPHEVNTNTTHRVCHIVNNGTYNIVAQSVNTGNQQVTIEGGSLAMVYVLGDDVVSIGGGGGAGGGSTAASIGLYVQGQPNDGETLVRYVVTSVTTFSANFAGSQAHVEVNPTANATFNIGKNGTNIGTMTVDAGGGTTFTLASATVFNPDDYLTVTAPSPQDATLSDISITLKGLK